MIKEIIMEEVIIEKLKTNEIKQFSKIVDEVFDEFVGKDYSEEGRKTFKEYTNEKAIIERINNNEFFIAKYENIIVGTMEIRNKNHISLFFVLKEFHGKGIGRKLFEYYIKKINQNADGIKIITVNSSFYGEKIYRALGFIKTAEVQEKNGIKYIPMEYKLK
jgi:predicted GNAT family N-acyltransferase